MGYTCFKKIVFSSLGTGSCAKFYITLLFIVLSADFMVLNVFYFNWVSGDPSLAGRFDMSHHEKADKDSQTTDQFFAPVIVTLCILVVYYVQYLTAMFMGCYRLKDKGVSKSRKVVFLAGQIVHAFFILCALYGVFSRHFVNGGFQLVAYTVINFYVWLLVFANWPVKVYFREYEVDVEET